MLQTRISTLVSFHCMTSKAPQGLIDSFHVKGSLPGRSKLLQPVLMARWDTPDLRGCLTVAEHESKQLQPVLPRRYAPALALLLPSPATS